MEYKRVVITGMGAITPLGSTIADYWQGLLSGQSGAGPITHFDASKFKTKFACEVKGFNLEAYLDRKEGRKMDPFAHYAVGAGEEALKDAGLIGEDLKINNFYDPLRFGVIWASGIGGLQTFYEEVSAFAKGDGTPRFNPFFIPKMIVDIAAGHISMRHGLKGPNYATVSACASSTHAIMDAFNLIRIGKVDAMVCGGSEAAVTVPGVGGFNAMKAMSERNDDPTTASRPYDKDRDGFVLGEGGGALILEELESAIRRGANIIGEVVGCAASADAYHITAPDPAGEGVKAVMRAALEDAGIETDKIDYINTHGTSTPLGDIAEIRAIEEVFGEQAYKMNISSTKSMTGHLLGGAGAIESVACLLALQHQVVPPTINHFTDDEAFDPRLNFTFNTPQSRELDYVLSNTFGFGGHNSSAIFRRYHA